MTTARTTGTTPAQATIAAPPRVTGVTPSQTIGPFFAHALPWPDGPEVVPEGAPGAFWLRGRVLDTNGEPVPDALVETWQADPDGRFDHPDDPRGAVSGFRGYGRCPTGEDGSFAIRTCKPGPVPSAEGMQAPHIAVSLFARGVVQRLVTRVYFPDEQARNAEDPVLARVDPRARQTLLAQPAEDGYRIDFHLQGDDETAFFAV